jgi:hypothetical protein
MYVSAIIMAVAAGVQAYSSYQQGKTTQAIHNINAGNQMRNAQIQAASMQAQANLQKQQAAANFAMNSAEAQAKFANAEGMENKALSQDAIDRENARKRDAQFAEMTATQRANIAASGAIESSGTPLDLLSESAGAIQRDREEQQYANELRRRSLFHEAANERLGGHLALAGATLNRDSAVAEAGLRLASSKATYLAGMREAQITRLTGRAAYQSGVLGAYGAAASGLSSVAGAGYRAS